MTAFPAKSRTEITQELTLFFSIFSSSPLLNVFSFSHFLLFLKREEMGIGTGKIVASEECQAITLMSVVKGRLEVTTTHIAFHDNAPFREDLSRMDFKVCDLWHLISLHYHNYHNASHLSLPFPSQLPNASKTSLTLAS